MLRGRGARRPIETGRDRQKGSGEEEVEEEEEADRVEKQGEGQEELAGTRIRLETC